MCIQWMMCGMYQGDCNLPSPMPVVGVVCNPTRLGHPQGLQRVIQECECTLSVAFGMLGRDRCSGGRHSER